jgi:hypothetical protein
LNLFVGLALLLEGVCIRAKEYRSGDEVNNVPTAAKPPVLLIEAKVDTKFFKTRVVIVRVIRNKVSDTILKAKFVNDFTNAFYKFSPV